MDQMEIRMAADTHPDFHLIHRMLGKMHDDGEVRKRKATKLSVEVIRQFVIARAGLQPSLGRAKVFVIVEAERMSDAAQNALLKTLEEPPDRSYLILLTPSADMLGKMHDDGEVRKRKATKLSVEVIRQFVIARAGLQPSLGRAKVFVIVEAERMSDAAQNALLKTLEEPPDRSYLILLTPSADNLLPTTRSRCQEISFQALPTDFIHDRLIEGHAVDAQAALFLAELAQGSLGTAIHFLRYQLHEKLPDILEHIRQAGQNPIGFGQFMMAAAKELGKKIEDAVKTDEDDDAEDLNSARLAQGMYIAMLSTILRDVQRSVAGHPPAALPRTQSISIIASGTHTRAIGRAIREVASAEYQIVQNANTALILDAIGIAVGRGLFPKLESAAV